MATITETRRNLFTDPEAQTADGNVWSGTTTLSTVTDPDGQKWRRGTRGGTGALRMMDMRCAGLAASTSYRFVAKVRASQALPTVSISVRPNVAATTGSFTFASGITIPEGESILDYTFTSGGTAMTATAGVTIVQTAGVNGATLDVTDVMILPAPGTGPYFSPAVPAPAGYRHRWTGAANASPSVEESIGAITGALHAGLDPLAPATISAAGSSTVPTTTGTVTLDLEPLADIAAAGAGTYTAPGATGTVTLDLGALAPPVVAGAGDVLPPGAGGTITLSLAPLADVVASAAGTSTAPSIGGLIALDLEPLADIEAGAVGTSSERRPVPDTITIDGATPFITAVGYAPRITLTPRENGKPMARVEIKDDDIRDITWTVSMDLTGWDATVRYKRIQPAGAVLEFPANVTDPAGGVVTHTTDGVSLTPGVYHATIRLEAGGQRITAPTRGYGELIVTDGL